MGCAGLELTVMAWAEVRVFNLDSAYKPVEQTY